MEGVWDRRQRGSFEELQRGQVTGANRGREQVTQVKIKKKEREKRGRARSQRNIFSIWILTQEQKEAI